MWQSACMGKLERIIAALEALPAARRDEIADIIGALFHADLSTSANLDDEQIAELRHRVANPGPMATDDDVDAFFARFSA